MTDRPNAVDTMTGGLFVQLVQVLPLQCGQEQRVNSMRKHTDIHPGISSWEILAAFVHIRSVTPQLDLQLTSCL